MIEGGAVFSSMISYHMSKKQKRSDGDGRKHNRLTGELGRKEGALMFPPSMLMIMGMLLISTSSYGVTERDIVKWVRNGSLPLLNAFGCLLDSKKQKNLKTIASFFRHSSLPTEAHLQRIAANIHVACGYKPPSVQLVQRKSDAIEEVELKTRPLQQPGRLLRPSNIPLVLANMIADLGLSQTVLDYSLSIMGYPVVKRGFNEDATVSDTNETTIDTPQSETKNKVSPFWLPPALKSARPDRLIGPSYVLAVVIAACKMIPSWDEDIEYLIKRGNTMEDSSLKKKNGQHSAEKSRFIPWNQEHFSLLGNGPSETEYLDFLEGTILFSDTTVLPNFVKTLTDTRKKDTAQGDDPAVRANSIVLRVASKREETGGHDVSKNENGAATGKEETTDESNANPPPKKSRKKSRKSNLVTYRLTTAKEVRNTRTFDAPLGPMIEYFAYKTGCRPDHVLQHLIRLDKDLSNSSRTHSTSKAPIEMHPEHLLKAVMKEAVAREK